MEFRTSLYFFCLCVSISLFPSFTSPTILFQGFNWDSHSKGGWYNSLKNSIPDIANAGITHVWLPPPSSSAFNATQGYIPERLYDLTSRYGNQDELKSLIGALKQKGIKAVADIVINHRAVENGTCNFEGGTPDSRLDWGPSFICKNEPICSDGKGNPDSGQDFPYAIDIDQLNPQVQKELSEWMNWLKTEIGFEGWRFDFVRGYASSVTKVYMEQTSPSFAVGENWPDFPKGSDGKVGTDLDAHRREIANWIEAAGGGVTAFDFTTKGILNAAVEGQLWRLKDSNGKPSGLIGIKPDSAVTFIDNHDTGPQQVFPGPFPPDNVSLGYAYILTHPGIPSIYYDHLFEWGEKKKEELVNLSAIRTRNGINATSSVNILAAEADLYMAGIDDKIIVKIGPKDDLGNLLPPNYQLAYSGINYAVWEKNGSASNTLSTNNTRKTILSIQTMNLACSVGLSTKPNLSYFHSLFKYYAESKSSRQALLLFRALLGSNVKPNDVTFAWILKALTSSSSSLPLNSDKSRIEANQIHTFLIKSGVRHFVYVSTAFLDFHTKLGCLQVAHRLFDDMLERDVVSWNALICGFSRNGYDVDALKLFVQMCREGFNPQETTLVSLVPSCGRHELIFQGKSVHGFAIKAGLYLYSEVKNVLTSMYGKYADLDAAKCLFEEIDDKGVISWNTMIGAYGQNGFFDEAMLVFKQMMVESVKANPVTLVSLLSANANPETTHCHAIKLGIIDDISVIASLVCEYSRCGNSVSAELLYKSLPQKNLVPLTAILSCHAEKGNMDTVMRIFAEMQQLDMKMDAVAMVSILRGIRDPAHFGIALAFHGYGFKSGLSIDNLVTNGLISMYSSGGDGCSGISVIEVTSMEGMNKDLSSNGSLEFGYKY
ncbi:hypothetical protein FEM48_Zijuj06G0031600 [Ziziphus jujuba var. spinosa]|uniref:Alpha-amylase n=1 Tax=Ziziphus jujuba var. spinosa TaxID=714518 RepID=A0A978V6T7_ZIZJJ|nr:hypothetical protein FEM48_Zijuj06G0031600 [Ziziphus jujuba var. spinosa]